MSCYSHINHNIIITIGGDRTCFLQRLNGATRGSKEETFEMFSYFLDFISRHLNNFELWFKILRTYFLTIFFPNVCKDIGLVDKEESKFIVSLRITYFLMLICRS